MVLITKIRHRGNTLMTETNKPMTFLSLSVQSTFQGGLEVVAFSVRCSNT
jgi:hypothetical protein